MSVLKKKLHIPQGTESFFLDEAYRHRKITRELENLFQSWGYLPIHTPVFDFFDVYQPLLDNARVEQSYRMLDRDGEILMLRSDITLFLARQMGLLMKNRDDIVRVYYSDSILRHQDDEDITSNEFFQSGCELIGQTGRDADKEILILLCETLDTLSIEEYRLHLGSRSLFNKIFNNASHHREAETLIQHRNKQAVKELLTSECSSAEEASFLCDMIFFIGTADKFLVYTLEWPEKWRHYFSDEINELTELSATLKKWGYGDTLRIDLSETGAQPYYSGIVFQAYSPRLGRAFASGGRYNNLLESFGENRPAAGFSLLQRQIERISTFSIQKNDAITRADGKSFDEKLLNARKSRESGKRVLLSGETK